jgi:signal transduction histidine kinase
MYFRVSENSKGNVLGLYIVKKAVEKLKGRIEFESVHHKGSTFQIYLPEGHPAKS